MTTQNTQPTQDQITVRITLGAYDYMHPEEKHTQVYVQIPEVARVSYMLPAARFEVLKHRAWPEVLDTAHEHYAQSWTVGDPTSEAARAAVHEWLRDTANRDEMQAAYEADQARQNPVLRNLQARVAELEADRAANDREYEAATARVAELEGMLDAEQLASLDLKAEREKLVRWHDEDSKAITRLASRLARRADRLKALQNDALSMRGSLAPADGDRKVPFELGETLTPAVDWLIARIAELEAGQGTAYRASHDSIVMGLYTTPAAARAHCEAEERRMWTNGETPVFDWVEDEEDGVFELVAKTGEFGTATGYTVTPLDVDSEYDPEADQ